MDNEKRLRVSVDVSQLRSVWEDIEKMQRRIVENNDHILRQQNDALNQLREQLNLLGQQNSERVGRLQHLHVQLSSLHRNRKAKIKKLQHLHEGEEKSNQKRTFRMKEANPIKIEEQELSTCQLYLVSIKKVFVILWKPFLPVIVICLI